MMDLYYHVISLPEIYVHINLIPYIKRLAHQQFSHLGPIYCQVYASANMPTSDYTAGHADAT